MKSYLNSSIKHALTSILLFFCCIFKTFGQANHINLVSEYVVDSVEIGDYRFGFGVIRTSEQLAFKIDSIHSGALTIYGLKSMDFVNNSKNYKDISFLVLETKKSLHFKFNHVTKYNEGLNLTGFIIDDFTSVIRQLIKTQGGYFINITNCKIHNFSNWNAARVTAMLLTIKESRFSNPSFVNIHHNIAYLRINNTDLDSIDSPDIYRLIECNLSHNKIKNPPIIPLDIDRMVGRIYFVGNSITDLSFIRINYPEAVVSKRICKGRRCTKIILE
jgi:hypothetical protein